jgi:hypothetical protein
VAATSYCRILPTVVDFALGLLNSNLLEREGYEFGVDWPSQVDLVRIPDLDIQQSCTIRHGAQPP